MREIVGDLWNTSCDAICVTTNGVVSRRDGSAIMGKGVALEAKLRYPELPKVLGGLLSTRGNHVHWLLKRDGITIYSFPTKHDWRDDSDIELIIRSCNEIATLASDQQHATILLPRPGCGSGNLSWEDVRPSIGKVLDDRFIVVSH